MKTLNKAQLIGALGKDPEVRYLPSGNAVATFSVATNSRRKNQSSEYTDVTQWHNCVSFGKLAEIVSKYLHKGAKVYVEGEIEYQQWDDKGVTKYATKIVLKELSMLSSKNDSQRPPNPSEEADALDDDSIPF